MEALENGRVSRKTAIAVINALAQRSMKAPPPIEPRSEFDLDRIDGYRTSFAAWASINVSVEHLCMLLDTRRMYPTAPFTLMRCALENATLAVWLLHPEEQSERGRRRLKLALHELREEANMHGLIPGSPAVPDPGATIAAAAELSNTPVQTVQGRWSYRSVVRDAAEFVGNSADELEAFWSIWSAFTHGREWAREALLRRKEVTIDGEVQAHWIPDAQIILEASIIPSIFAARA